MNEITVKGRGLKSPTCTVRNTPRGVEICLDDNDNPEFWLRIIIPHELTTTDGELLTLSVFPPEGGAA